MEVAVYVLVALVAGSILLQLVSLTRVGRPATLPQELSTRLAVLERIAGELPGIVRDEGRLSREDLRSTHTAASQLQGEAFSAMRKEALDGRGKLEEAVQRNADAFALTQTTRLKETNDTVRDLS